MKATPTPKKLLISGVCGLKNLGNTCYMNSALQCLSNVQIFTKYIKQIELKPNESKMWSLFEVFCQLIDKLWSGTCDVYSPTKFKDKVSELFQQFKGNEQNDSSELLIKVLNQFNEDLKPNQQKELHSNYETFDDYLKDNNTFIAENFVGFQRNRIVCKCGHTINDRSTPFSVLILPQIDDLRVHNITVCFLKSNNELYSIGLQFKQNIVTVEEFLRNFAQKFSKSSSESLDENNLIAVQIKNCEILKVYDKNSDINDNNMIKVDKIDGFIYIYLIDTRFANQIFVVLSDWSAFGLPLVLNVADTDMGVVMEEFNKQIMLNMDRNFLTTEEHLALLTIKLNHYSSLQNKISDPRVTVLITDCFNGPNIPNKYKIPNDIPIEWSQNVSNSSVKLEEYLKEYLLVPKYTKSELLCVKCTQEAIVWEKFEILYSPNVLIFQLKSSADSSANLTFDYPPVLNLNKFVSFECQKQKDCVYYLTAVVIYSGNSDSGHYFTYAKNIMNKKWYKFNDSSVDEISDNELQSSDAYLLFYVNN